MINLIKDEDQEFIIQLYFINSILYLPRDRYFFSSHLKSLDWSTWNMIFLKVEFITMETTKRLWTLNSSYIKLQKIQIHVPSHKQIPTFYITTFIEMFRKQYRLQKNKLANNFVFSFPCKENESTNRILRSRWKSNKIVPNLPLPLSPKLIYFHSEVNDTVLFCSSNLTETVKNTRNRSSTILNGANLTTLLRVPLDPITRRSSPYTCPSCVARLERNQGIYPI